MNPLSHQGHIFELKVVHPAFDNYRKKLEKEISNKGFGTDLNVLIALLNKQYSAREQYFSDPFSDMSVEWVSRTDKLIVKIDSEISKEFNKVISKYESVKSSPMIKMGILEPIKSKISKQILDAKNQLVLSVKKLEETRIEEIYEGGKPYEFLMNVIDIINCAKQNVFIVDPYFDDKRLNLFISKIQDQVEIKILIGSNIKYLNKTDRKSVV